MYKENQSVYREDDYLKFKYSSQIDFIRSLKNANDEESIRKLALAKEDYFFNNKKSTKR
ncbi:MULTISPECIES: hypothetical protein [Petrotoga]|uniref:Uncharacterized protein n=3 Tax=Petrotoga TaxID=28236 RepID=A0A4R8EKC8_9BACT|nr:MULTISPECIES: hypothetical protein [Petrotoga]KUK15315.1 MAG: hypothetical protein XD53_1255 [Petrotoga mobilis]PNR96882.1 hypothetical protein X929_04020 [Petrotoga olearia DSM 13574]RMA68714.1 hypothetical protein C8D75_1914 [Petrotoga olearia]TDX10885.1 hypothetical protein C8D74_1197 [Petrotoga sibirica]